MKIRWSPEAAENLEEISGYLEEHLPAYRRSTMIEIYRVVLTLKKMPQRGRLGARPGERQLIVPGMPYVVTYRVSEISIEIASIRHSAREPQG